MAAHPLDTPSEPPRPTHSDGCDASVASLSLSGRVRGVAYLPSPMPPGRSGALSLAAPASPLGTSPRDTLESLRQRILAIERPRLQDRHGLDEDRAPPSSSPGAGLWSLGAPEADARLGRRGLDTAACHEIKPAAGQAYFHAAALAFSLALAHRRLDAVANSKSIPRILWCSSPRTAVDTGHLYPPGLARFGLSASSFLMVEARREDEVLWTLEEGLRSGGLALVIGVLSAVGLTPARRLSLAARDGATPLLLLTSARAGSVAATATRWRIGPAASAAHPFDARTSGVPRLSVKLERCRSAQEAAEGPLTMEWCHEAFCFRMAAPLADRTAHAPLSRRRAG